VSRPSAKTPAHPADGQVCALFAVDIAGFTGPHRDDDIRQSMVLPSGSTMVADQARRVAGS
jgi:hypothetical protein